MSYYTEEEEQKLNNQLKIWKKRQLTAVRGNNVDSAFTKMSDIDRVVWEKIAKADNHKDVNPIVWELAESVITKYCKMSK
jgi:hypothetical protein